MFSLKQAIVHLLLGAILGFAAASVVARNAAVTAPLLPVVPSVEMVRNLSQLTTLRVDLADVEIVQIAGWSGAVEAALLVKGDFTIGTNLAGARFQSIDHRSRTAEVVLPQPTVSPPRLDHARSRLVLVQQCGLWQILPGSDSYIEVTNRAFAAGERALAANSHKGEHEQAARRQAEEVLRMFFSGIGWNVSVRWS